MSAGFVFYVRAASLVLTEKKESHSLLAVVIVLSVLRVGTILLQ
jgi:hypothetical protein